MKMGNRISTCFECFQERLVLIVMCILVESSEVIERFPALFRVLLLVIKL
jgi:hypothetical protein